MPSTGRTYFIGAWAEIDKDNGRRGTASGDFTCIVLTADDKNSEPAANFMDFDVLRLEADAKIVGERVFYAHKGRSIPQALERQYNQIVQSHLTYDVTFHTRVLNYNV